jgi:hypothetical protein
MTTDQAQAPKGDLPSLSKGQKVLASVVALLLIGTIVSLLAGWLTRSGSIYTRSTETARSNAVFTMREGFNTAVAMEQYLGGAASRRDVQVARALLARRLSVIDFKGQSAAANAAQSYAKFVTDLNNFDTFLRAVPGGTLTPAQQAELGPRGLALSKQLALSSAQVGDVDSGNYKKEALAFQTANEGLAASNRRDLILLSLSLITGALLLIWLTRDLRRRFARSSQSLEEERERVRQAQIALDRSAILETGQSRILKHIAAGAPVVELLHSVVKLASDATGGRPFRIVSGSRVISSRGMDGAQSTSAIAKQWPFG